MRMLLISFALLGLTTVTLISGDSNLTFFGAPRASLDSVLPVLSIEEHYIRSQTDGSIENSATLGGFQCSNSTPCADGSCCNSQGQCGFRDEHCKSNCVANCDALAPCGVNSRDGLQMCPLNVCCSYFGFCGTTDSFCRDTTASGQKTPCQRQFGTCGATAPPICSPDSGTASRRVAYYEAWNTRRRPCDKVYPENIDTTGLTHLIFSFATIDPNTFTVGPMHPDDEKLYVDFLNLNDGSKKWIGIGGWEFSDVGATHYTWSQMASSRANRSAFIASLLKFLDKWSFQGVDIDWEWPGAVSRGGNPDIDMRNQIDLMAELRESLSDRGLSVVLPAQYGYLKNMNPKALEAQVDFFNLLAYDLHGPWDAIIPGNGALIKPHTDLKEIDIALGLFWFSNVQPSKINLGVANYGRGYTVADESCSKYNCAWTGPSKAGECTQLEGVLSQCEIQRIIRAKGLSPTIVAGGAGVKQITFDKQWVGYDDDETIELKSRLANYRCLGGTVLWAIDYASCSNSSEKSPGALQSSSAVPFASAPGSSVATSNIASSAMSASSTTPASSASEQFSSTASLAPLPAQSFEDTFSAPFPTFATKTQSDFPTSNAVLINSSIWSSAISSVSASLAPISLASELLTQTSSGAWPTALVSMSPSTPIAAHSSQTSQWGSLAPNSISSAARASLSLSSTYWSQTVSGGASPVVILPSIGSSRPLQSSRFSQLSSATTTTTFEVTSVVLSSSTTASNSTSAFNSNTYSGDFDWSASTAVSSTLSNFSLPWNTSETTPIPETPISLVSSTKKTAPTASSGTLGSSDKTNERTTGSADASLGFSTSAEQSFEVSSSKVRSSQIWSAQLSQASSNTSPLATFWSSSLFQTTSTTTESAQSLNHPFVTASQITQPSQTLSDVVTSGASSALSWSKAPSTEGSLNASLSPDPTSSNMLTLGTSEVSLPSYWSIKLSLSTVMMSGTYLPRPSVTSKMTGSNLNGSRTQSGNHTTEKDGRTTGDPKTTMRPSNATRTLGISSDVFLGSSSSTSGIFPTPEPTDQLISICPKCSEFDWCSPLTSKKVTELPRFPPAECLDFEWCIECWPKPSGFNVEVCPLQCWLLEWCKPLCGSTENLPAEIQEPGTDLDWFTAWWWKLPVKGCVPNDCRKECVAWYGLTLATLKNPVCPCIPRTCTKGEEKENRDKKRCKLFGCGCSWLGLPIGPGCKTYIDWSKTFPWGIFGQNSCEWFGGCKIPPGPPPGPPPKDDKLSDNVCGPLGCNGYCYIEGGCPPCPAEICGGPKCTRSGGCGPKTGVDPRYEPTQNTRCEEEQKTTVTERIVSCFVDLKLEPTTIASINYTQTETLMSACVSFEATHSGCSMLGAATTTRTSSFTSTLSNSQTPMCTRAPLDLDNDEGDNEQPHRTLDGLSCTNAPLSLDEDEGDNEQSLYLEVHACSRAPLSLDDDEGNNEMPADMSLGFSMVSTPIPTASSWIIASLTSLSMALPSLNSSMEPLSNGTSSPLVSEVLPPSTLSTPSSNRPWGTDTSSSAPTPGSCINCKIYFDDCAKMKCQPDGSDAESCAKWCLTALCQASDSIDYCKVGPCKHSACPKDKVGEMSKGILAGPFTTVLSLPSTEVTITATPPPSSSISLSASATPKCNKGGSISPDSKWTAYLEHQIKGHDSSLTWTLWDQNGCEAGNGSVYNSIVGADLLTDIGAQHRPQEQKAEYMVHTNVSDSTISSTSEIQFTVSKPPAGCSEVCRLQWKINNSLDSKPWQIADDCAQQCGMRKLDATNVNCDHGINKFQSNEDGSIKKRGGYCTWHMSVELADDDAPPPPFTRNSIWRLELRQQMEHKNSEIEWWLHDPNLKQAGYGWKDTSYADIVNILIETQDRDSRPQDKMKYKMQLTVSKPRNKDKSKVQIQYVNAGKVSGCKYGTSIGFVPECNPSYVTESDDNTEIAHINTCEGVYDGFQYICDHPLVTNKVMSCDAIPHAFYSKDAGFERKFACWWPHDFAVKENSGSTGAMKVGGFEGNSVPLGIDDGVDNPLMKGIGR